MKNIIIIDTKTINALCNTLLVINILLPKDLEKLIAKQLDKAKYMQMIFSSASVIAININDNDIAINRNIPCSDILFMKEN